MNGLVTGDIDFYLITESKAVGGGVVFVCLDMFLWVIASFACHIRNH